MEVTLPSQATSFSAHWLVYLRLSNDKNILLYLHTELKFIIETQITTRILF